ncbi:hypothetical protein PT974_06709 [Cladobotryum mycophilum]|uniref:Uncharacterized protein n=1 Tax=Cladobotryum mycophilum TaxID=491253 RepID=A0ABR0SM90_9HYPO
MNSALNLLSQRYRHISLLALGVDHYATAVHGRGGGLWDLVGISEVKSLYRYNSHQCPLPGEPAAEIFRAGVSPETSQHLAVFLLAS